MGLCKCPKRKVTNLFCFEHRVNVCEHCLVENHQRCVVKSYLNWLKDSDYDPNCQLCSKLLSTGNVVRLLCYDVFHEACLDRHFRKLPANTAPAGYKCSSCDMGIFPLPNQAGKVVEQLRSCLSQYNWARLGLGMPLIEESEVIEMPEETQNDVNDSSDFDVKKDPEPSRGTPNPDFHFSHNSTFTNYDDSPKKLNDATELMMDKYEYSPLTGTVTDGTVPRKIYGASDLPDSLKQTVAGHDPDGKDKYKRRPPWTWLMRWIKSRMLRTRGGRSYQDLNMVPKKVVILLLVGIIALFTIIIFATQVGRRRAEDNPFLDPMANPNIHIAHHGDDNLDSVRLGMHRAGPVIHDDDDKL